MTDEELLAIAEGFGDRTVDANLLRAVFEAGAASRDAEFSDLSHLAGSYLTRAKNAEQERDKLRAEVESLKQDAIPEGWKLVPVEPTGAMKQKMLMALLEYSAGDCDELSHRQHTQYSDDCTRVYKAMLAAAPKGEK